MLISFVQMKIFKFFLIQLVKLLESRQFFTEFQQFYGKLMHGIRKDKIYW